MADLQGQHGTRASFRSPVPDSGPLRALSQAAGKAIDWMPNSVIQALGRLPPVKKLGQIRVVYPITPYPELQNGQRLTNDEVNEKMALMLTHAEKVAVRSKWMCAVPSPLQTQAADCRTSALAP